MTSFFESDRPPAASSVRFTTLVVLLSFILSSPAATAVILEATDAGFVTELGGSAKGDGTLAAGATFNYSVGIEVHYADGSISPPPFVAMDRNNYFVFDLSAVGSPIVGASLLLFTGVFESVDPAETFEVVAPADPGAALADAAALLVGNSVGSVEFDEPTDPLVGTAAALYGNIESSPMPPLAGIVVDAALDGATVSIPFVDLAYLNAFIGGPVFLGGTVPDADPASGSPQQPFGFTGPDLSAPGDPTAPKLVLTLESAAVPEPGSLALLAAGLIALGAGRRCGSKRRGAD